MPNTEAKYVPPLSVEELSKVLFEIDWMAEGSVDPTVYPNEYWDKTNPVTKIKFQFQAMYLFQKCQVLLREERGQFDVFPKHDLDVSKEYLEYVNTYKNTDKNEVYDQDIKKLKKQQND